MALSKPKRGLLDLPPEMVNEVLEKLEPEGYLALVLASPYAEAVAWRKRRAWMMELVFPHLFPYLSTEDILKLRQVCGHWSSGVDRYLSSHPNLKAFLPEIAPIDQWAKIFGKDPLWSKKAPGLKDKLRFQTLEQLDSILEAFQNHARANPFPHRSVALEPQVALKGPELSQFWNRALALITRFGGEIHYLEIIISGRLEMGFSAYQPLLLSFLHLTPNLVSLELFGYFQENLDTMPVSLEVLPFLPKLKSLDLAFNCRVRYPDDEDNWNLPQSELVVTPLLQQLVQSYGPQLDKLGFCFNRESGPNIQFPPNLFQIQELNIRSKSGFQSLQAITTGQLTSLTISGPADSLELFQLLEKLPLLQALRLPKLGCLGLKDPSSFQFPSVRFLTVNFCPNQKSWLLPALSNLEQLDLLEPLPTCGHQPPIAISSQ